MYICTLLAILDIICNEKAHAKLFLICAQKSQLILFSIKMYFCYCSFSRVFLITAFLVEKRTKGVGECYCDEVFFIEAKLNEFLL